MDAKIAVKMMSGTLAEETQVISFSFIKDAYTPYTTLMAKLYAKQEDYVESCEIFFYVGTNLVHHGLIDSLEISKTNGKKILTVVSRGFTSLLCQNQIEPGIIYEISINKLFDSYYSLPYVEHENNSDESNYIYVKNNSTMWDGVANLSYKLTRMYPYIRSTNTVRITAESNPKKFSYNEDQIIESGMAYNFKRMISNFNMTDLKGNYGAHTLLDYDVTKRKIIRYKMLEIDRQFLYDPPEALRYRTKFAKRGNTMHYCRYNGYNGEDLCDIVSFDYIKDKRICRIEITGNSDGIFTEIGVYYDGFYYNGTVL